MYRHYALKSNFQLCLKKIISTHLTQFYKLTRCPLHNLLSDTRDGSSTWPDRERICPGSAIGVISQTSIRHSTCDIWRHQCADFRGWRRHVVPWAAWCWRNVQLRPFSLKDWRWSFKTFHYRWNLTWGWQQRTFNWQGWILSRYLTETQFTGLGKIVKTSLIARWI